MPHASTPARAGLVAREDHDAVDEAALEFDLSDDIEPPSGLGPPEISAAPGPDDVLADGTRVLDCHASYGAVAFGHRHPALVEAARRALSARMSCQPRCWVMRASRSSPG